jgi:GNAT superfamily N-acetyltransferase
MPKPGDSKTQTVEQQLAAAVELNAAEWMRSLANLPWVEFHDDPDVQWSFACDTWPRNSVAYARFKPTTARHRIREILAYHWKHKAACNWTVGPVSQPADLSKHLKDNGFSCRIHCAGMACDLRKLGQPPPIPEGVTIKLVDEPPSLLPLTTERRKRRHEGHRILASLNRRTVWHFSATFEQQAVGETVLLDGTEVAGIYDVEVTEEFRRRGIGSALIHAALRHGRKLGHTAAVLGATGMGSRVYARLGFRELCKLSFWKYGKMRQLG